MSLTFPLRPATCSVSDQRLATSEYMKLEASITKAVIDSVADHLESGAPGLGEKLEPMMTILAKEEAALRAFLQGCDRGENSNKVMVPDHRIPN